VTLHLQPQVIGTHLTLTHTRFVDARHRDMHIPGWGTMLDGLRATAP